MWRRGHGAPTPSPDTPPPGTSRPAATGSPPAPTLGLGSWFEAYAMAEPWLQKLLVLVCLGCHSGHHRLGGLRTEISSSRLWRLGVQDRGASTVKGGPLSGLQTPCCVLTRG